MPYVRKLPSGKWQATVKHPSGRRYTKSDPLKRIVTDWGNDLELQIKRGTFIDPDAGKMRLATWWTLWSENRTISRATASNAETHWRLYVEPAFGSWPLVAIGHFDITQWIARMRKDQVRPSALAAAVRLLKKMLEAAVVAKKIPTSPADGVKAPKPPEHVDRFLDYDERETLLTSITMVDRTAKVPPGTRLPRVPDLQNRLFVKLMLDAGLRWQEAAGQHVFRIDRRRNRLRVKEVVERGSREIKTQPKSPAGERWVPLTDELMADVDAYLVDHPGDGLLFTDRDGGPLDYNNWLKRVWKPAIAAAELADPQPTPHDCRHSYGSWLAEQGVPPHEIMTLMGHSTLRAVEIYIHASEARMQRTRDALDARTSGGARAPVVRPER